ncbi:MAG: hydroxyacid dehydrogenase [Spirochaetes bacterium GWF1_41_5]|nr:MAG: hydroxyacid dehydrogenase [Spirochaetes bacterium GWF1_41_5]
MKIRIAFFDARPYDQASFNRLITPDIEIKYFPGHLNEDTAGLAAGSHVVCAFVNDLLSAPVIETLIQNGVKLAALRCAGYNNVDLNAAYGKLHVIRVPAYSPYAVAEHAVSLMMALNRKTHKAYARVRDGNFAINGLLGFDMNGKTAGIIGTGKIGKVLVRILAGFGMKILAFDHHPDPAWGEKYSVQFTDRDTIYRESDIISLNCPLNKETHHMINEKTIVKMKHGVMLINTGRGGLIDSQALIDGLKNYKIGAAGLDVYEEENEFFFEDHSGDILNDDVLARLLTFPNVIITSHQGFFTAEAMNSIAETTIEGIKDFFDGKSLVNEICYRCDSAVCVHKEQGRCF